MQTGFRALRRVALVFFISLPVLAVVQLRYPQAARGDHIDHYHGIAVPDPYRWMEDIDSPQTRTWVEAQGKLSGDYLFALPHREEIARRLKAIWNFERWNAPEKDGSNWFYAHNAGLQNQ